MQEDQGLRQLVANLLESQLLAVLATQSQTQPHASLLAFASTDDLTRLLFVTNRNTTKYTNAVTGRHVAMLVDNRGNQSYDFSHAVAVTASGTVSEVTGERRASLAAIYLAKHPSLEGFLEDPSQSLMEIVVDYYRIARFTSQEVLYIRTW